jgi:primary-amine oxidase
MGMAIVLALGLGLLGTQQAARAQTITCSASNLVDVTLTSGARWQMCWETRTLEGIVLHDITYTAPGQPERMVLAQANLAQVHVPYDDNGARFHDLSDYGLGGNNLDDLTPGDCPNGTLIRDGSKDVLCRQIQPEGYAYKYYATQQQGYALNLFSVSHIGQYNYVPELHFYDNGVIEFGVGATGQLQRLGSNPAYGWPLNAGNTTYGISHMHNYYWRLDFDINGTPNDDQVEQIEFTPNGARELFTIGQTPFTTEAARAVSPVTFRSWRIKDTVASNADGHAISYHLEAEPSHLFHGPSYEPFTQNELYVTVNKPCEKFVSHNPTTGGCGGDVSAFVNGESLSGADLVVWYGLSFHHLARDEDQTYMSPHWSSFKIVPRDWSATNPMVGAGTSTPPTATITATVASPTVTATVLSPTAEVTVTPGPSATATQTSTPITPTSTPAPGQELIVNGGFEGSASPWSLTGHAAWSSGPNPHSGTGYFSLANVNNAKGTLYQQITVPSGAAPVLTFWLNVISSETTPTVANDVLYVEIRNSAGALLQTPATFSNLHRGAAGDYIQRGAFNLGAFAGQTIRVQFRVVSNGSLITTFLIDDVSVR